jgi:glycosyltransferase involved in cell wall biosynthesis
VKIARVATVPFFLFNHLREQIVATVAAGHEVVLISSAGEEADWLKTIPGIRFHAIDIPRRITPWRDFVAMWRLAVFFRRERFDIVHSTTPKAGMLCALAGFAARVPVRLHTFTGQVWVEMRGMMRAVAKAGDWLTAHLNTKCYADSVSQRDFIITEGVCDEMALGVLGAGSLSGVDLVRFDPARWSDSREVTRRELGIPAGYKVIAFIGRLTRDKGLAELKAAFHEVRQSEPDCILLLVGPGEAEDGELTNLVDAGNESHVRFTGYTPQPERYLAVTDLFCLPSYREGFGNVVIEAAAMGVPAIGTDIVGLRDAIVGGETGLLVPPRDSRALAKAIMTLLGNRALRIEMGEKARRRAVAQFDSIKVNAAVLDEYRRLTGS